MTPPLDPLFTGDVAEKRKRIYHAEANSTVIFLVHNPVPSGADQKTVGTIAR